MNGQDETLTLERFESLLDTYGGDLSRWPGGAGRAAEALVAISGEARALHAEARDLDLILAKASRPSFDRLALLADRICVAAEMDARQAPSGPGRSGAGARIIELPANRVGGSGRAVPPVRDGSIAAAASAASRQPRTPWRAMAALAASLAFGVAIGLSDLVPAAVVDIGSLARASSESEIVLSGLQLDGMSVLDEDQI